jgi:hypothetical protein
MVTTSKLSIVKELCIPDDSLGYKLVQAEFVAFYDSSDHELSIVV